MKISQKLGIIVLAGIIIVLMKLTIYAYFTNNSKTEENLNFGYSKIELIQNYDPPMKIEKGCNIPKEIAVKNKGNVLCYVRIKVLFSDLSIEPNLEIDFNKNDYIYNLEDGYWYYKKILNPEEVTEKLFTNIKIKEDANDIALNKFKMYTYVETVQATEEQKIEEAWEETLTENDYNFNTDTLELVKTGNGKIKINKKIDKNIITNDYDSTFFFEIIGKDDSGIIKATYIVAIDFKESDYINSQDDYIIKNVEISDLPNYNYEITEIPTYRYESNKVENINNAIINEHTAMVQINQNKKDAEIIFETLKLKNTNLLSTSKYDEVTIQASEVEDIDVVPNKKAIELEDELTTSDFKYIVKYTDGRIQAIDLSENCKINDSEKYIENQSGEHKVNIKVNYLNKDVEKDVEIYGIPNDYYTIEELEDERIIITGINDIYEIPQNLYILSNYNNKKVVEISDLAFTDKNFQEIIIYEGIEKIGNYCFNNSNIENIEIPKSLEKIQVGAFECEQITNVDYQGSEEEFSKINILEKNENFKNIKINYKN